MRFPTPLLEGRLVRRYKRFLADVELADGAVVTVHCANPGSMLGLAEPGMRVLLSRSTNAARKLPLSWELVEAPGCGLVGINTALPNRLVEEALRAGRIAELAGYPELRREVAYGTRSRVDFLLAGPGRPDAYVEVKNVHFSRVPGLAEFPDSVTARGARHLDELALVVAGGGRAAMLYLVQRTDSERFAICRDLDPAYGRAFDRARAAGVEMLAYRCAIGPDEVALGASIPLAE
jgi:sugar fermentation stimulation protein A